MIVAPLVILAAFLESPVTPVQAPQEVQVVGSSADSLCAKRAKASVRQPGTAASESASVANLPFAMGRRFATLDEYLTHLECHAGPIDLPWWKQIRPGVYKRMTTATNAPPNEVATRAELMKRFGFNR
jgi:hypothetical protein